MQKEKRELKANGSAVKAVPFPNGSSKNSVKDYMNAVYDASKAARMAQLEAAYQKGADDLKAAQNVSKEAFDSQRRQMEGLSQQANASFNQLANAYGLNSGAVGQAALIRNNQVQTNMGDIARAYRRSNDTIEQQKQALERDKQYAMQQVIADNEYERNKALYAESVRIDNLNRQQAQMERQQNFENFQNQYKKIVAQKQAEAKAAEQAAKASANASSGRTMDDENEIALFNEYLKEIGITDFQATVGMPYDAYVWMVEQADEIYEQKYENGKE